MEDYSKKLDDAFESHKFILGDQECSKLDFIGDYVFDFITYDGEMSELFAITMIEVLKSMLDGTTFEYQEKWENYVNYLLMINMPFLIGKIEWGTSIRGAWLNDFEEYKNGLGNGIDIPKGELSLAMVELIEWSKK